MPNLLSKKQSSGQAQIEELGEENQRQYLHWSTGQGGMACSLAAGSLLELVQLRDRRESAEEGR